MKGHKYLKKFFLVALIFIIYLYYAVAMIDEKPIEQYDVSGGYGIDLYKEPGGIVKYKVPFSVNVFQSGDRQFSMLKTGEASTVGETRQNRQLRSDKQFLLGSQRLIMFSESFARYGLINVTDILFTSPTINDRGTILVCRGETENILSSKVKEHSSTAEYIEAMVINARANNFFSKEYTNLNMFVRLDTEGRNLVLPYLEISERGPELNGMALFKKDKMVSKIDIKESKLMNIMREDDVKGILTIQKNSDEFINLYANTRRKVRCNKLGNKYEFQIIIDAAGDVIANTLFKDIDKKAKGEIEDSLQKGIEKECNGFISRMQNEYKVDCLELGMNAVAKYGRDTGVDWDQVIENSDIKVKVNVKVDRLGRGAY